MKKSMANQGLRWLVAAFVLVGVWMFSATETKAQTQSTDIVLMNQSQNLNWLTETEAMGVLENLVATLANTLSTLTPGTPAYNDALNHLTYYKLIYNDIENGSSTMLATNTNLFNVTSENGITRDDTAASVNLNQLYQDALALLTF